MTTVKEFFHDGIASGNWEIIREVYKTWTGEEAPEVPVQEPPSNPIDDFLNMSMGETTSQGGIIIPHNDSSYDVGVDTASAEDEIGEYNEDEVFDFVEQGMSHGLIEKAGPWFKLMYLDNGDTKFKGKKNLVENISHEMVDELVRAINSEINEQILEHEAEYGQQDENDFSITHKDNVDIGLSRACRTEPFNTNANRENGFEDDGEEHADDIAVDKKLAVKAPRKRGGPRDKSLGVDTGTKIRVKCYLCEHEEDIEKRLAIGYSKNERENTYKCNDCCTPGGYKIGKKKFEKRNGRH